MVTRCALITGVLGQDGRLLAHLLVGRGYRVVGTTRGPPPPGDPAGVEVVRLDLRDQEAVTALLAQVRPDEVYNFAAFATGQGLFDDPVAMADANGVSVVRLLEAVRQTRPAARLFQAGSSEVYGYRSLPPQSETSVFAPRSPYGAAKLYAQTMVEVYRRRFGLFAVTGILFNHESPLRSPAFVTRKVTRTAARIAAGLDSTLALGSLESRRDWGYAGDYVEAARLMLAADTPADYVIATGETHSVGDLCALAFDRVGLDYRDHVREEPAFMRPEAAVSLVGDAGAIRRALGWRPRTTFPDLVYAMVDHDVALLRQADDNQG